VGDVSSNLPARRHICDQGQHRREKKKGLLEKRKGKTKYVKQNALLELRCVQSSPWIFKVISLSCLVTAGAGEERKCWGRKERRGNGRKKGQVQVPSFFFFFSPPPPTCIARSGKCAIGKQKEKEEGAPEKRGKEDKRIRLHHQRRSALARSVRFSQFLVATARSYCCEGGGERTRARKKKKRGKRRSDEPSPLILGLPSIYNIAFCGFEATIRRRGGACKGGKRERARASVPSTAPYYLSKQQNSRPAGKRG